MKKTKRIGTEIPSDTYLRFKQVAAIQYKSKKRNTNKASIEAVDVWIE